MYRDSAVEFFCERQDPIGDSSHHLFRNPMEPLPKPSTARSIAEPSQQMKSVMPPGLLRLIFADAKAFAGNAA